MMTGSIGRKLWVQNHLMRTKRILNEKLLRPRPGHADLNGAIKYGHQDMRNVLERSSARETTFV